MDARPSQFEAEAKEREDTRNPKRQRLSQMTTDMGLDPLSPPAATAEKAFSFLSRGWREVKDSADADLQLMRARATSIKNLADRELENFLNPSAASAAMSPYLAVRASNSIAELEFVKRIRPKLTEIRRVYSSPDFSKKVLEKWGPRGRIGIDLSAIRSALVKDEFGRGARALDLDWERFQWEGRKLGWKVEGEEDVKEWEPIRKLKTGLRKFERKSQAGEVLGNFKKNEFVEKVKLSLNSLRWDNPDAKDVPPLDVPELLAYLVKQSGPLFDHLGIRREIYDKIVDVLCSNKREHLIPKPLSTGDLDKDNVNNELDYRIATVLQSTGHHLEEGFWDFMQHNHNAKKRHFAIITTASLPWMTGTAVNPLFRAAYLAKASNQDVTLLVPWLCKSDQELVYPNSLTFSSPEEQEFYIRNWLEERTGLKAEFKISFYPGKFSKERRSIIPAGDTTQFISSNEADIAILEEPEHLNWYHHGKRWTDKFNHVIGVVHTNYLEYIKREKNGALQAFFVKHINNMVVRAYCDKVLRLSAATQDLPKSTVCNVHGVNPKFLEVGEAISAERQLGQKSFSKGAYFLGKMVWAKGYRELLDLMAKHKNDLDGFKLDVYGNGEDAVEVQSTARKLELNLNFLRGRDHADDSLHGYKVFINPSVSDVLCTATAEALAMGKFVVCADHPSNEFFKSFPNCLTYRNSEDFVGKVKKAMNNEPQPLTTEQRYNLSWEAATNRFMEYSELDKVLIDKNEDVAGAIRCNGSRHIKKRVSMPALSQFVDGGLAFTHNFLTGNKVLRLATGAIPGSRDYDLQHCRDLHLLPPYAQNPIYGW